MSLSAVEALVLSYTFRSHPYQNAVECGCCSKVFFGLRAMTATIVATPGGLFAFPYFAFAKYTARPAHRSALQRSRQLVKGGPVRGRTLLRATRSVRRKTKKTAFLPSWGAMWGSNPRHLEPQSSALPTELIAPFNSQPLGRKDCKYKNLF